ncbi:hypothetical protein DFQ26_000695, partial [Actinomortierella ambigua]
PRPDSASHGISRKSSSALVTAQHTRTSRRWPTFMWSLASEGERPKSKRLTT